MGVLDGFLVVDLSEVYQGPVAAQVLGDFGADVIKIERPGVGEILRSTDRYAKERGLPSAHFAAVNRNKKSIALDLKDPTDLEIVKTLLSRADVVLHNYRPGVAERLGLGYEELSVKNPRLVYACATGFGEAGPLRNLAGQDLLVQSLSGMARESGSDEGEPSFVNAPTADFSSGMLLAQGIALALLDRERTGKGQKVSTSLFHTALAIQSLEAASQLMHGRTTHWFNSVLNFVFRTTDGWISVIGFFRENPLALLCAAVDLPDLSEESHLDTLEKQLTRRDEIKATIQEKIGALSTDAAMERLVAQDILCAPILSLGQALQHPQARENGMIQAFEMDGQGTVEVVANPLRLSGSPAEVRNVPPKLDQDRHEILDLLKRNSG